MFDSVLNTPLTLLKLKPECKSHDHSFFITVLNFSDCFRDVSMAEVKAAVGKSVGDLVLILICF